MTHLSHIEKLNILQRHARERADDGLPPVDESEVLGDPFDEPDWYEESE